MKGKIKWISINQAYLDMMEEQAKKQLFVSQMKSMRPQQLTNVLKCMICRGLFRFAHTIVDCGHTFCQFCIFTYIRSFKGRNPSVKCPQCNGQIDSNYARSIMRDVFKQNLVDILQPSYVAEEEEVIKRVNLLFPEQDLEFLLDEFKFYPYQYPQMRKKNSQKNVIMGKLVQKIKLKLNITFETFVQQISNQHKFNQFLQLIQKQTKKENLLQIRPKSQRQQQYVGINNKIKAQGLTVSKVIRFIQKKAFQRIKNCPQQVLMQFLNPQKTRLDIKIRLECDNLRLQPETDLSECSEPIYYVLL